MKIRMGLKSTCLALVLLLGIAFPVLTHSEIDASVPATKWVYLTWQGNTSTTLTVNYQTTTNAASSTVYFGRKPRGNKKKGYPYKAKGVSVKIEPYERWVHHVELTGLKPGVTYYFVAGDSVNGFSEEFKFKTIAKKPKKLKMVVGGDMGFDPVVDTLMRLAAGQNPDLAIVGGDISYADGNIENLNIWDAWFMRWTASMVTENGYTIPIVTCIGNHEVKGYFGGSLEDIPFYFKYFPQNGQTPYYYRNFGDLMVLFVLDTYHFTALDDPAQINWLDSVMSLPENQVFPIQTALYHVPLYPSYSEFDNPLSDFLRANWMPIFDKNELDIGFENHDHAMKRTKFMKNGKEGAEGTVYIGDGAWGRGPRESVDNSREYLAHADNILHFWVCEVNKGSITLKAIDKKGAVADNCVIEQ